MSIRQTAPLVAALTAWVSLNPYPFWGTLRPLLLASLIAGIWVMALFFQERRLRLSSLEASSVVVLSVFLVYITVLPRVHGGHMKWISVLPSLWLLTLLDDERRRAALSSFATIFVITVIPALSVSVLAIIGLPLTFGTMPAANSIMAAAGTRMLVGPAVLFIESNSVVLPWGGVLFRLCGMYDEPGTVGTISAFLLAAYQYRFKDWRVLLLYLAGLLSFSLAFAVLTTFGLLAAAALRQRFAVLLLTVPILAGAALATGLLSLPTRPGTVPRVTVANAPLPPLKVPPARDHGAVTKHTTPSSAPGSPPSQPVDERPILTSGELRQTKFLDNRSLPSMEALVADYRNGGYRVWLFGMGTDASVVRGGVSQTWKRLMTDYGLVGCVLFMLGLGLHACSQIIRYPSAYVVLFLLVFVVSIYQRPIVWMPYALLLLFCGPPRAFATTAEAAP